MAIKAFQKRSSVVSIRIDPPTNHFNNISKLFYRLGDHTRRVRSWPGRALGRVEERIKTDAGDALQIVLQTTRESLNLWIESNKFELTRLAADPRIVFLAEHQLQVPRNKDDLLKSLALKELRRFFQNNKDRFGKANFFIIAPDFVNIASMGDENTGSNNRIASQALDLLNRAFKGESANLDQCGLGLIFR
jgi:hypothetical protein